VIDGQHVDINPTCTSYVLDSFLLITQNEKLFIAFQEQLHWSVLYWPELTQGAAISTFNLVG
jgi:hypothetical protein